MAATHTYKLTAYPKQTVLRDETPATLKPMTEKDGESLGEFFLRVPPEDRYFLKEDVTSPKVIARWVAELDYDRALPILVWVGDRIVADGTLHRTRSLAHQHVGEVRIVVDPEFRDKGIGTALLHEIAVMANENGLEKLILQAVAEKEDAAIRAADNIGFVKVGTLKNYAKGADSHPYDLVIMEMLLGKWFEWWDF